MHIGRNRTGLLPAAVLIISVTGCLGCICRQTSAPECFPGTVLSVPENGTVAETECSELKIRKNPDGNGYRYTYVMGRGNFGAAGFWHRVFRYRHPAETAAEKQKN